MITGEDLAVQRVQGIFWPARSRAVVIVYRGEERRIRRNARRMFGRPLQTWEFAGLAGAPDDAQVELGSFGDALYIEMGEPAGFSYRASHFIRREGADLVLVNLGFHIHLRSMRQRGLGLRVFHRQLQNAKALRIRRIEITAGRRADENGYYTWPRFGFDGPLPRRIRRNLPLGLEHARSVLDLMDCEKGRLWWREHGVAIRASFEVGISSRSRSVFDRYVRNKFN